MGNLYHFKGRFYTQSSVSKCKLKNIVFCNQMQSNGINLFILL